MTTATLSIDLSAIIANWRALDRASGPNVETGAVVKADGYGLGAGRVAKALADIGVRKFFVAAASEGATLRQTLGNGPEINVFSGHMDGDTALFAAHALIPMINSPAQLNRHITTLPDADYGLQLDSGMNRLGMHPDDWARTREVALAQSPTLVMSHLACADDRDHDMNARQLKTFQEMSDGINAPRSLSATGGILLGRNYHFDLTRPGIGLYGGAPFHAARPVASLDIPVIQTRTVPIGQTVGYSNTWTASKPTIIATIAAGYADGLIRCMGHSAKIYSGPIACPIVGRISMDMIGVDITHLDHIPTDLQILGPHQTVDDLATHAGTIGYEILTSLGARHNRRYSAV